MIVLDTTVVSELMKSRIDVSVRKWFEHQATQQIGIATTAITIAEINFGLGIMPEGRRKSSLQEAFALALQTFDRGILPL